MGMRQRFLVLIFLVLVLFPLTSLSQDFGYKGAAFGGAGYGRFAEDEGLLGTGLTYRAGAEWRFSRRGALEGELYGIHFTRKDYFRVNGDTQFVLANALFYFSRSNIQPYLKGGIGLHSSRYSFSWPSSSSTLYDRSTSGVAVGFGAGVKVFVNRRWSVNPDFRIIGAEGLYSLFGYFSVCAGYHW